MAEATKRQSDVLAYVTKYQTTHHGRSPTVRDIAKGLGMSTSRAYQHLVTLRGKDLVTWEDGQSRTIRLL